MQLRPHVDVPFTRGPALAPVEGLKAWLAAQRRDDGHPRLVRVPVVMDCDGLGQPRNARVGGLPVALDDSALGISLADRVRQACPGAATCHAWLEGLWDGDRIKVRRFVRAVAPGEVADFVEVEAG